MKKFLYILILILVSSPLFGQSFKGESQISIRGTAINNIGEIKARWETGTALYLSYENISTTHFSYMFQVGYINYKQNPNYVFDGTDDPYFYNIPIQVGGRYYILTNWIRPFLMAMTGANILNTNYGLLAVEDSEGWGEFKGTNIKLNFQVGLGLAVKLFSELQLEVIANYNSHVLNAPTHYNITGLELGAGLNWGL